MNTDPTPYVLAQAGLLDAAAWLHSIGTAPGLDPLLASDARAAADEVMHIIDAYPHLWRGPLIADPQ